MPIIFNEDPNHYIYSRAKAGVKTVTEADLRAFIRQYRGTNISDFLVCVNASHPFFPTKRQKSILDRYAEWEASGEIERHRDDFVVTSVKLLSDAYRSGLPFHQIWLDEIRACGMRAWVSLRMNDIHNAEDPNAFLPSDFVKAHPEYLRCAYRGPAAHPEWTLDYAVPEVRALYLSLIEETLETFDLDGLELDYMREPFCFAIGKEQEGLALMTAFVGEAAAMVKKAEKRVGHKILLAARVPESPRKCMRLGLDVTEWAKRGYLDRVFVTPHWSSADSDMPIDLWRRILPEQTRLAAGLEVLLDAYNRKGRAYRKIDLDTAIGFGCAYQALGAEDIYLFNFMDEVGEPSGADSEHDILRGERYRTLLSTLGDEEKCVAAKRKNIVTFGDTWMPAEQPRKPLPLRVQAGEYQGLRIPTGVILAGRRVTLRLGFERGLSMGEDVSVYADCVRCRCLGKASPRYPAYDDMDYYDYEIRNHGDLPIVTVVEIAALRGETAVHWAEIVVD